MIVRIIKPVILTAAEKVTRVLTLTASLLLVIPTIAIAQQPDELYRLGNIAMNRGDITEAMRQLELAAEQGYAPAQSRLGWILDGAELNGDAVNWYRKAARQGDAEGQFGLASMYLKGEGIEKNNSEAFSWLLQSAQQGYSPAMGLVATAHEQGLIGVEPNINEALQWIDRGLAADMPWAIQRKAKAWRNGELGLTPDITRADDLDMKLRGLTAKP